MMRKFLIGVLAGVALAIPASAQSVREAVYADPARAGGVYYMMPVTAYSVTAPPKGYEPVYLSHYGRHGARYLLNDTQYERSLGVLRAAHDEDALTELDERLWQEASAYFEETCRFRAGDLTPLGWEQHYRIAQEIYKANRKFFRKKPAITAGATQVPRCIVSMAAFCQGLVKMDPSLDIYEAASKFDLVFNMQCTPTERSLMWLFTPDERYSLWEVNNYIHYMESAPPATKRDLPALWNLVDDGDRAVAAGKPAVRLRFGHDTVFLATLSMVGADGFDIVPGSADGISATWYNFRAPMAATLYFLLCKNREGDVIFKLVVNGADATLPLEAVSGPWYRWNDLKALIASRFPRG